MPADASVKEEAPQYKAVPIMAALLISGFIGMLSETGLNIAISELMGIFNVEAAQIQWLTTGFILVLAILTPVSGLLLQWFTTRQLFVASLLFSIIGTLVAALAPSFEVLLVARLIQAAGTGLLIPLMFNTVLVIFPPHKRGAAMGIMGLVIMFAPAVGPAIAGLFLEYSSWRAIFWMAVPLLVGALIFGIIFMRNVSEVTRPRIDLLSIALSSVGFGGIVFGFSTAGEGDHGWSNPKVIIGISVGAAALLLFIVRQLRMRQPMMNLRAFRYPMFTMGTLIVFVAMMIILSTVMLLPLYLQAGMAMLPLAAGLLLLPGGLVNGLMSPVMGRLFDKYGPRWLVLPGLALVIVILWLLTGIEPTTPKGIVILLHTLMMIGISMIMMPASTNGLNQLPRELYPDGTAIMNTLQQVAGAIGTALAISVMSAGQKAYYTDNSIPKEDLSFIPLAMTQGVQSAFMMVIFFATAGFILSLFIKRVKVDSPDGMQPPMH
ncbi:DHA2 family efflux MFS transporter permease subunit [Paenibacillus pasadenensis]|uniref:DHA2 family efflux MFS transporter permease subunit n=1 Tax=Paenibacillus pasadenensis TaxID=217090 RepID=UPI00203D44AF|nr:DHA2 family efflux MFS transporter permease subunit [Paenibacillus pasadenensis]MCM3750323.1 DHA2 family efflux MFS transporter permease subunit [Paenibacillus pasadenensis]